MTSASEEVRGSMTAFLSYTLKNDFHTLKEALMRPGSISPNGEEITEVFIWQLIEELFRYLYLLARSSAEKSAVGVSPSKIVAKAFHCILLDPILYYQVCDTLLLLAGYTADVRPMRVLPHNPLCTNDQLQCMAYYQNTLSEYKICSHQTPPEAFWPSVESIELDRKEGQELTRSCSCGASECSTPGYPLDSAL